MPPTSTASLTTLPAEPSELALVQSPRQAAMALRASTTRRSIIVGAGLHVAGAGYDPDSPLATVVDTYRNWLHFPDPAPIFAALGVAAGHMLPGSPVWLMLVGQASCGKTEVINSLLGLPNTISASTVSEASLLSGSGKKDRDSQSTGGIMREIGPSGILLLKDFTSILRMDHDSRDKAIGALGEIYDGRWNRPVGADGGRNLQWEGRMSVLAGCTPVIDDFASVMVPMGSRFMFFRFDLVNGWAQADKALESAGVMAAARESIQYSVQELFRSTMIPKRSIAVKGENRKRLISLANFTIRCRAHVTRDYRNHEIISVSEPEAPGRFVTAIQQLYQGMTVVGVLEEEAWRVTCRVAMDSMPALRLRVIQALSTSGKHVPTYETNELAHSLQYPATPVRRCLEDLEALRIIEKDASGKTHSWQMTEASLYEYRCSFPKSK